MPVSKVTKKKPIKRAPRTQLPRPLNVCGGKIKAIRKAKKNPAVSQDDLAKRVSTSLGIEIDQSAIARLERGQRIITDYELTAIAKALKVDVGDLFR